MLYFEDSIGTSTVIVYRMQTQASLWAAFDKERRALNEKTGNDSR
jgi:hypothetical protein